MLRVILLTMLFSTIAIAEKVETRTHDLSATAIDIILHWDNVKKFPFKNHFFWENEPDTLQDRIMWSRMRKKATETTALALNRNILKICETLGYIVTQQDVQVHGYTFNENDLLVNTNGNALIFKLELNAPDNIHRFFNSLHSLLGEGGITTPKLNLRLTALSMPVKVVRQYGLDFFPPTKKYTSSKMSSKDFAKLIDEITQIEGCTVLTDISAPTVSGKSIIVKDTYSLNFPEDFNWIGTQTETLKYDDKGRKLKSTALLKAEGIGLSIGEPRNIGVCFEVTPTVEPDGYTVSLDLLPGINGLCGWTMLNSKYDLKMPLLKAQTIETRLTMGYGQAANIGCLYDRNFLKSAKHLVSPDELKNLEDEKCIVYFVTVDNPFKTKLALLQKNDLTLMLKPAGDKTNKQLIHSFNNKNMSESVKNLLMEQGVKFPPNAPFYYDSKYSVIYMLNTSSEISKVEKILGKVTQSSGDTQRSSKSIVDDHEVRYSFIELETPASNISNFEIKPGQQFISKEKLKKLLDSPKVSITNIGSGLTQNGNTTISRNVLEAYIPEEYENQTIKGEPTSLPIIGESVDIGGVYEITPQIDPDGHTIEIELRPYISEMLGWEKQLPHKGFPSFRNYSLDTRVKMKKGDILLISNSSESKNIFQKKSQDKKIKLLLFYCNLQTEGE
ncbi:MAG: hypothetical protein NE334_20520 [Lentisphaeraceae bacterium]|nr:hypothetical protein [Lentisphaeraceae bacterium]